MNELARLIVRLTLDARQYAKQLRSQIGAAAKQGAQLGKNFASSMTKALSVGLLGITALLGSTFTGAIRSATDFEAQMSQVQASLGATAEETAALGTLAKDLAVDPKLSVGASDAAASFELLARNGVAAEDILGGVGRAAITLTNSTVGAKAQLSDFALTADVMTDAMAIYGKQTSEAAAVTDSITGVINNSKFSISTYQTALAGASRATSGLGVSLEDTNTALALISPAFGDVGSAGNSLSRLLLNIASPTDKAQAAMNKLGISAFDLQGNFVGLPDLFDQLREGFDGLSEADTAKFGKDIAGAFGANALTGILKATKSFEELDAAVNKAGLANETAGTRVDNFQGALNLLRDTWEGAKIAFGEPFLGIFNDLLRAGIENAQPFIDSLVGMAENVGEFFDIFFQLNSIDGDIFTSLTGALSATGGEGLIPIVEGIQNAFNFFVENKDLIIGAITGITAALAGFAVIAGIAAIIGAITNPIFLIVAAIGLLAAAWNANFLGIKDATMAAWTFIQGVFVQIQSWFNERLAGPLQSFKAIWASLWVEIQAAFGPFLASLQNFISSIALAFGGEVTFNIEKFKAILEGLFLAGMTGITIFLSGLLNFLTVATTVFNQAAIGVTNLKTIFQLAWTVMRAIAITAITNIKTNLQQLRTLIVVIGTVMRSSSNKFATAWGIAKNAVTSAWAAIKPIFDAIRDFASWLSSAVFSFDFQIPDLPAFLTPGSPIPLHTRWQDFDRFLNRTTFRPRVDASGLEMLSASANAVMTVGTDISSLEGSIDRAFTNVSVPETQTTSPARSQPSISQDRNFSVDQVNVTVMTEDVDESDSFLDLLLDEVEIKTP